jgi:glucose-6-phosphate 1-dehydrogenase
MLCFIILFERAEIVAVGWQAVQPFLYAWMKAGDIGLTFYQAGSDGSDASEALLARDGHNWRKPC